MDEESGTFRATLPHGAVGGPRAQANRLRRRETLMRGGLAAIGVLALLSTTVVLARPTGPGPADEVAAEQSVDPIGERAAVPLAPRTASGGATAPAEDALAGAGDRLAATPPAAVQDGNTVRVNAAAPGAGPKRVVSVEPRKRVVVAPAPATAGEDTVAVLTPAAPLSGTATGPATGGTTADGTVVPGSAPTPEDAPTPPADGTIEIPAEPGVQVAPGGTGGRGAGGTGAAIAAVAGVFPQAATLIEGRVTAGVPFTLRRPGTEQAVLVAPTAVDEGDPGAVVALEVLPTAPGETQVRVPEGAAPGPYLLVTLTSGGAPTGLQLVQVEAPVSVPLPAVPVPPSVVPPAPAPSVPPATPSTPAPPTPTVPTTPTPPAAPIPPSPAALPPPATATPTAPASTPATLAAGSVRSEAEGGQLDGSVVVVSAEGASGGQAVGVAEGSPEEGTSRLVLNVPVDGTYVLWGRVRAPDDESNSFFVSVDGGGETLWRMSSGSSWVWHGVKTEEAPEPVAYWLRAGLHRVDVRAREDGTLLDAIVLTPRGSTPPS